MPGLAPRRQWCAGKVVNLFAGMILFFSPSLFGPAVGAQWQTATTVAPLVTSTLGGQHPWRPLDVRTK
jgi:hypothetical protein